MTTRKAYRRDIESRFSLGLTRQDRAKLDQIVERYTAALGFPISLTIALALAVDCLNDEVQQGKLRTLAQREEHQSP